MTQRSRLEKLEAALNIGDGQAQLKARLSAMTYEELQATILDLSRRILATSDGTPEYLASVAQDIAEIEAEKQAQTALLETSPEPA